MSGNNAPDPRARLVREKYFSLRPKPLERWLWNKQVPRAAERVFWLHWQEGLQRGDWCSELPLRRVASECCVDLSTVTKAYQLLARLGCLRRTDPGRDPANPFHQAVAVTEVRIPQDLLAELHQHPNRRAKSAESSPKCVQETAPKPAVTFPSQAETKARDPFAGLSGRDRVRAMARLTQTMSAAEQRRYQGALRTRASRMTFDGDSKLAADDQSRVLQLLQITAASSVEAASTGLPVEPAVMSRSRQLSVFELARLKREVQTSVGDTSTPEVLRQVVWSIEEGSLKRFATAHAIHIALKKIREGAWTRPHRLPPNWMRAVGMPPVLETCRHA